MTVAATAGLAACCGSPLRAEAPYRPNIVMLVVHDLGQHLGCYGVPSVQSPNIDRLAARGVRFENVYSTSGVCSPGRGSLHTGRYPQSNGLMGLTHAPWWWSLKEGERHTASYLKELGYETCLVGFQHLGKPPAELGYDRHLSRKSVAAESAAAAADLIRSRKETDRPLFVKIGFMEVHRPFFQLYDLRSDPYQLKDVAREPENAEIVKDLSQRLMTWMKQVDDPLLVGPTATPYYHQAVKALEQAAEE
jgi:arylsulfatase A-like enzyme